MVHSNSSSHSNRSRISSSLDQVPSIDICSSSGTNIGQSLLDACVSLGCISRNVDTSGNLDQTGPSAAWRVGLLRTGRNCAAGCCGACVDHGGAGPGFECAGQADRLCSYYGVGGDCHPACSLWFVSLNIPRRDLFTYCRLSDCLGVVDSGGVYNPRCRLSCNGRCGCHVESNSWCDLQFISICA